MRISAVTGANYSNLKAQKVSNTPNFKGILIEKSRISESFEYKGQPSGSSYNGGHYSGAKDTIEYTYYPFKDESESKINKVLKEKNYSSYDEGYNYTTNVITNRGKTLPISEPQWKTFSAEQQNLIKSLL